MSHRHYLSQNREGNMAVIGDLLFWSGRGPALSDSLRRALQNAVPAEVDKLAASDFSSKSDDDIVEALFDKMKAEPIELRLDEAEPDVVEKSIEVENVFRDRMVKVPGLRIAKVVPFDGEAGLFKLTPNSYDTNPPRGKVSGSKLTIGMEVRESEDEAAIRYIEGELTSVQAYIDRQRPQLDEYNQQLPAAIRSAVERRRATLGKASSVADRLRGR
ncbi:MAG TPA: hypothetical protein VGD23_04525 [Sphingomicrobium sp.]